ncbi:uncharacterized protein [Diadema antillarum]|uniref:uncharacterized protein n=1 Tax=Diadema antillarum TaxID=105358 RepID=UPI003A870282
MPNKPKAYVKLTLQVANQLESTPDGLMNFRNTCRQFKYVDAFGLDKKRAFDVIERLERRLILGPNNFEKFVELLEIIDRDDVIRMLPGYENYGAAAGITLADGPADTPLLGENNNLCVKASLTQQPCGPTFKNQGDAGISEIKLYELAEKIRPDEELGLAVFLGIPVARYEQFDPKHRAYKTLIAWKENVTANEQASELVRALKEAKLPHLAWEFSDPKASDQRDVTQSLSRESPLTDKHLFMLGSSMGEGWWAFGIKHLDMSAVDIDGFCKKIPGNREFEMLLKWKNRECGNATVGRLLDLMEKSQEIPMDCYKFLHEQLSPDIKQEPDAKPAETEV